MVRDIFLGTFCFLGCMNIARNALFLSILRLACAMSFVLLSIRVFVSGGGGYLFLLWNLFLAAVPYALSTLYERVASRSSAFSWRAGIVFALWLFFFPNAPYIVTDFIHLPWEFSRSLRFAYDFVLVTVFTFAGLLFGMASLFRVHRTLRKFIGTFWANAGVIFVLLLSGIGIYLGRFLRWNSWDMLLNPLAVLQDAFSHYGDPAWFARAVFLSMLFAFFTGISYAIFLVAYRLLQGERVTE